MNFNYIFSEFISFFYLSSKSWFFYNFFFLYLNIVENESLNFFFDNRFFMFLLGVKFDLDRVFDFNVNFIWNEKIFHYNNIFDSIEFLYYNIFYLNWNSCSFNNKKPVNLFAFYNLSLNRFINYKYWIYNYNWLKNIFQYNRLTLQTEALERNSTLLGFKFHCSGRFSRKQRATSYFFIEKANPLNTLKAFIDYGFYTIPIRNSAIGVKIWLYKRADHMDYFLKIS